MDVVVLGAFFADGRHRRGMITSYLVGLKSESVDFDGKMRYLPFCKVSGGTYDEYREAQRYTGYRKDVNTGQHELGKWWMSGTDRSVLPDHISKVRNGRKLKQLLERGDLDRVQPLMV